MNAKRLNTEEAGAGVERPAEESGLQVGVSATAGATPEAALRVLGSRPQGLAASEAVDRRAQVGPNALRSHAVRPVAILLRQFSNPIELLLLAAAGVSLVVGQYADALVVIGIVLLSAVLGFVNEWRSERAVAELHDQVRHVVTVRRDGRDVEVDVTDLVPGDVVHLAIGQIVPADLRLLEAQGLECDEAVLTGETTPVAKQTDRPPGEGPLDLPSCAFMGTTVLAGTGLGLVVATGTSTVFGRIAAQLGERHEQTAFDRGLRDFRNLLVKVTAALIVTIFAIQTLRGQGLLDTVLFALAVAVGLTPQLLPALVALSLARGSAALADRQVLVKRLVAIEDLGNVQLLFTDKTGTLTTGTVTLQSAVDPAGREDPAVAADARVCSDVTRDGATVTGGNPLDRALWAAPDAATGSLPPVVARLPFDHDRQLTSVLVYDGATSRQITKGAPEAVFARCGSVPPVAHDWLASRYAAGIRVIAVAAKVRDHEASLTVDDEAGLDLLGFVTFLDPPKPDVADALARLRQLDIDVKVITGDHPAVATHLCEQVGLQVAGVVSGAELAQLDDERLVQTIPTTTVFGRVTPEQKERVVRVARAGGTAVAFLGDGVNDAVALHGADVGISVDTATDVAKDAASVVLLRQDLHVLADGVVEGRRIFVNTMKYVLMATSSNFGNMFSLVVASLLVPFLPLLPTQVLLNNLLYDLSQTPIPRDDVDAEQLARPAHWDLGYIRRFMLVFGPVSSLFDVATFGVLLWVFRAGSDASLFQSGWFVESLLTQTLIVFVIRTRRVPFWRSRPARVLAATTLACAALALALPFSPLAGLFGFVSLSAALVATIIGLAVTYLVLIDQLKRWFHRRAWKPGRPVGVTHPHVRRRRERRAARFSAGAEPPHHG